MTIYLTEDEIRRLLKEAINQALDRYLAPIPTVVPVPDDDAFSCSIDDDELPPLALTEELVPPSIPSIPFFPEAVEDAFDSFCVADDALQFAVPASQARPSPSSCYASRTGLPCAPCTLIYIDTVLGSFIRGDVIVS
jgi:hypothetical protein